MYCLILDHEKSTIEALKKNISWQELHFDMVFSAQSQSEAMAVMEKHYIDVLLCDAELAAGSGLAFAEWIQQSGRDVCLIFMAHHADFALAQKAIRLGAFDYILKPLAYKEMEDILRSAAEHVQQRKQMRAVSIFWKNSKKALRRQFWRELYIGEIRSERHAIEEYLYEKNLDICPENHFLPILITPQKSVADNLKVNHDEYRRALTEVTNQIAAMDEFRYDLLYLSADAMLLLFEFCPEEDGYAQWFVEKGCRELTSAVERKLTMKICCYLGYPCEVERVADVLEMMQVTDFNNIQRMQMLSLFKVNAGAIRDNLDSSSVLFAAWEKMVDSKDYRQVQKSICQYLDIKKKSNVIDPHFLRQFNYRYSLLLFVCAQTERIFLDSLFNSDLSHNKAESARKSIDGAIKWVCYTLEALDAHQKDDSTVDPIEKVRQFVKEHLSEEISVEQIAAEVHLNSDYLNRIFKKTVHTTIGQYIIRMRIETAQYYLKNTDYSIGDIAAIVGYYNYSSFNRSFLKQTGRSPNEWKTCDGEGA